jgi:hypothetical protein
MRIARYLLIWSLVTCGLALVALHRPVALKYAATLGDLARTSTPADIAAGVPFVVRDSYATQICVSTRAGQPYPPFVAPADSSTGGSYERVQAGVPFLVRDRTGTQVCISTRDGQALPPFIMP